MNFIDHTGHIFSLPSYRTYPAGYEYDEQKYIFWLNETNKLSVNNYYIKAIRFILDDNYTDGILNNRYKLSIKVDSQYFKLLGSYHLNNFINSSENIFDYFNISSENQYWDSSNYNSISNQQKPGYVKFDLLKNELTEDDVIAVTNLESTDINDEGNTYTMVTFYVVGMSPEENVMLTNILIELRDTVFTANVYCPITVGGEFIDECEPLIINGKNMGINLPKGIIRALFNTSFNNYAADETVYNAKIKELLLNYMNIKGECGNYDSVIKSLQWFGWGDKIKLSKLIQTDNEFISQYIVDNFNITNDTLTSFQHFISTTYIKLGIAATAESDETNPLNFHKINNNGNIYDTMIGEGKPKLIDLMNKTIAVKYDEGDINFYKPYYNYLFTELGLKLAALEYYYRKYFLPIHVFIHSSTIEYQCFVNDMKMLVADNYASITEDTIIGYDVNSGITVEFPKENFLMYYTQTHIVDSNFNEFTKYILQPDDYEVYWEDNDPNTEWSNIYWNKAFSSGNDIFNFYDLYWVNENCLTIPIKFSQNTDKDYEYYNCQLILEKLEKSTYNYEYIFSHNIINTDNYDDEIIHNDMLIHYEDIFSLNCIYNDSNVSNKIRISHQLFKKNEHTQQLEILVDDEGNPVWDEYKSLSQFKEYIRKTYFDFFYFGQQLPYFNIKIQSEDYLTHIYVKNQDYIKYVDCKIIDDIHTPVYKTTFSFIQHKGDVNSYFKNFVIIPKIINKKYNVNFWLNSEFNLYLNVNGKWFTYNFTCKTPELQINLGKLEYKYYLDATNSFITNNGDVSLFKQLNRLTNYEIGFNMFMWQPNLVRVNNIDFYNNLLDYYKDYKYNILYNNDENTLSMYSEYCEDNKDANFTISANDVYYTVKINNQNLYIHQNVITTYLLKQSHKYIPINIKYLSPENRENTNFLYYSSVDDTLKYCSIFNERNTNIEEDYVKDSDNNVTSFIEYPGSSGVMNIYEERENFLFMCEDGETYNLQTIFDDVNVEDNEASDTYIYKDSDDGFIFVYEDEFNGEDLSYIMLYVEINVNNSLNFFIKTTTNEKLNLKAYKSIYKNENTLYNKYVESPNIVNNNKYINKVHMYDIYTKVYNEQTKTFELQQLKYNKNYYEIISLYNVFFNQDEQISSKVNIPDGENIYDFYLMHNDDTWYAVFITQLPITKYGHDVLNITNDKKEIVFEDKRNKLVHSDSNGYTQINTEILNNVLSKTGLTESDLLIVYNTTDDLKSNRFTVVDDNTSGTAINSHEYFAKYLINKIYNKNVGRQIDIYADTDEAGIYWNTDEDATNNFIGVNWTSIPPQDIVCAKCGARNSFTDIRIDENTNARHLSCNTPGCGNIIDMNESSILYWNDVTIPFKLIYSVVDDIYDEYNNPDGHLHLGQIELKDRYIFNMNNVNYYLLYDKETNSYTNINNANDNRNYDIYTQDDINILDITYNETTYSYFGKIYDEYNQTYNSIEIVNDLPNNQNYYTYIHNIYVYSKDDALDLFENINDFYILYNGETVFTGGWCLTINKTSTTNQLSDVIDIFNVETGESLQWALNRKFIYNEYNPISQTGKYLYKKVLPGNDNAQYFNKVAVEDIIDYTSSNKYYLKLLSLTTNSEVYINVNLVKTVGDTAFDVSKILQTYGVFIFNEELSVYEFVSHIPVIESNEYILYININNTYINIGKYNDIKKTFNDNLYIINITDYIQFDYSTHTPLETLYLDAQGKYFVLENKQNDEGIYEYYKQEVIVEKLNTISSVLAEGSVYNTENQLLYSCNYYSFKNQNNSLQQIECIIHHSQSWWDEHSVLFNNLPHNTDYDNLWYYISFDTDINSADKIGWVPVIYTNEIGHFTTTKWYYSINGIEYEYTGKITKDMVMGSNQTLYGIPVELDDPIIVDLTLLPAQKQRELYYDDVDLYYFEYVKSDNKFLTNRMQFIPSTGKNHFSTDDIIVATISNNMSKDNTEFNLEFKLDFGSKWIFNPMSLKMYNTENVVSNTEMAIMSIGDSNIKYERGYYDLSVNYSLDGNIQNINTLKSRILIK